MCVSTVHTQSVEKIFGNKQTITAYKVVSYRSLSDEYETPITFKVFPKKGVFKAHSNRTLYNECYPHGIHVFLNKDSALKFATYNEYIVPVLCERKHFIIADNSEAAFTQIRIHKRAKFNKVTY